MFIPTRTTSAFLLACLLAAAFVGATPGTAHASHTLSVTHTPLANGLVAGQAQTINATVTNNCTTVHVRCLEVLFEVHYRAADGSEKVIKRVGTTSAAQNFSVEVPANDIRYPQFEYWLIAMQASCWLGFGYCGYDEAQYDHMSTKRWPSSSGTKIVSVKNVATLTVKDTAGIPLSGGTWTLWLDTAGSEIRVSTGTVPSNGVVTLDLPATPDVLAAAAGNTNFANFGFHVIKRYSTPGKASDCMVHQMHANFGDPSPFVVPGVGGLESAQVVAQECPDTDCINGDLSTAGTTGIYPQGVRAHKIGTVHVAYDMTTRLRYGSSADSSINIGVKASSGTWTAEGHGQFYIHNRQDNKTTAVTADGYDTKTDTIQYGMSQRIVRKEYWSNPCDIVTCNDPNYEAKCVVTEELKSRTWDIHFATSHVDVHYNDPLNDNCVSCTGSGSGTSPYGVLIRGDNVDGAWLVNEAVRFTGVVCYLVCLGGSSGFSEYVKVELDAESSTKCPRYMYYDTSQTEVRNAKQVFIDAGDPGPARGSSGQPAGCTT